MEPKQKDQAAEWGRIGGNSTKEKHGVDYYSKIGKKGGGVTNDRHGKEHYARIGKLHSTGAGDSLPVKQNSAEVLKKATGGSANPESLEPAGKAVAESPIPGGKGKVLKR